MLAPSLRWPPSRRRRRPLPNDSLLMPASLVLWLTKRRRAIRFTTLAPVPIIRVVPTALIKRGDLSGPLQREQVGLDLELPKRTRRLNLDMRKSPCTALALTPDAPPLSEKRKLKPTGVGPFAREQARPKLYLAKIRANELTILNLSCFRQLNQV